MAEAEKNSQDSSNQDKSVQNQSGPDQSGEDKSDQDKLDQSQSEKNILSEHDSEKNKPNNEVGIWEGDAALGLLATRGNTNTESINARFTLEYHTADWTHKFKIESLRAEDNGTVTADRLTLLFRSQVSLAEREFLFASLRYDDDPFSGYNQRTTEVAGYGYQVIKNNTVRLDVEAGLGASQTERTERTDNTRSSEAIIRLASRVLWNISKTSTLSEGLFVEVGDENTLTESTTELKVKINTSLALKVSFKIKDNSDVPAGNKHTDSETTVALVYDF